MPPPLRQQRDFSTKLVADPQHALSRREFVKFVGIAAGAAAVGLWPPVGLLHAAPAADINLRRDGLSEVNDNSTSRILNAAPILETDNINNVTPGRIDGGAFGVTADGAPPSRLTAENRRLLRTRTICRALHLY
jgi:hypothetical protein